jgi:4-hydroxythreonine-4-phosphate dehydrogenase
MIAKLCGVKAAAMAMASLPLRTVMVTRHIPLKEVSMRLKEGDICDAVDLAFLWLVQTGFKNPRIGVCALNPHAGEKGLLGLEEIQIIRPAVLKSQKKLKRRILGPLPADSAFREHSLGTIDCLVTMYHDQSLVPLKLFNPDRLVNITLGLPFVRTSPGHGTAFDIAGKNRANPKPMIEAILTAARLSETSARESRG